MKNLKRKHIPRTVRIAISLVAWTAATVTLCVAGWEESPVGDAVRLTQIGVAVTSFSMLVFLSWLLVTLAFGRVYCSTVCPVGTFQDMAARSIRRFPLGKYGNHKSRYRYTPPQTALRYTVLALAVVCMLVPVPLVFSLIEPWLVWTRICHGTAGIFTGYAPAVAWSAASALVLLAILWYGGAIGGRSLCNAICPIGTALGCVSRVAVMQMDIDTDRCIHCGKCEDVCKGGCINLKDMTVDGSRCVVCFDCTAVCPNDAIRYTSTRHKLSTPMMTFSNQ